MEKPQVRFELEWRATVVVMIFVMVGLMLLVGGLYVGLSTLNTAQIVFGFVAIVLAGTAGWMLRGSRDSVRHTEQPEVIDVTPVAPQLPEPRFFRTDPNTFTRSTLLDDKARAIAQALRDAGLQPTRQNIKLYGMDIGIAGNEGATVIYTRFVKWGWAVDAQQGQPGKWADEGE